MMHSRGSGGALIWLAAHQETKSGAQLALHRGAGGGGRGECACAPSLCGNSNLAAAALQTGPSFAVPTLLDGQACAFRLPWATPLVVPQAPATTT